MIVLSSQMVGQWQKCYGMHHFYSCYITDFFSYYETVKTKIPSNNKEVAALQQ